MKNNLAKEERPGRAFDLDQIRRLIPYLAPHRRIFLGSLLLIPFFTFVQIAQPLAIRWAIDRGILAEQEAARQERKRLKLLGEVHELRQALGHAKLVHNSAQMEQLLQIVRQVAPTDATVLITGESGTGKGVLSHTIHKLSQRSDKAMVLVDCSAITATLIESELFGH